MNDKIYVAQSRIKGAGRGVFALADIKKGDVIEICPIIIFRDKDDKRILTTVLQHYVFEYDKTSSFLALGYGSLYNHSLTPNARYEIEEYDDPAVGSLLYFIAAKKIRKGEEICINYGPHFDKLYK